MEKVIGIRTATATTTKSGMVRAIQTDTIKSGTTTIVTMATHTTLDHTITTTTVTRAMATPGAITSLAIIVITVTTAANIAQRLDTLATTMKTAAATHMAIITTATVKLHLLKKYTTKNI
jgi:hypothetical protein